MKRWLTLVCSAALLLALLPMGAFSVSVAAQEESVIVNVKDFGAVGDGKTDDRTAIMEAFYFALTEYMVDAVPVTVYFPEGQYGLLNGGMYIYLPRGYGNLTVKGDGADKSTIVYLDEWDNNGSWVALRIQPKITPESEEQYLHDITIRDMGVYDTDPIKHAWNKASGDPGTEETHGFNIQYCVRATIKNCNVSNIGDEAIDMSHCIDSVMTDNVVENSPGAGSAGGSISVGDGSRNVLISNNTVTGSIAEKTNWGIAVEALTEAIEDITITNNTITDIKGYGINIGAPAGIIADVMIDDNTITNCKEGGIRFTGVGQTTNVSITNTRISKTDIGIHLDGSNKNQTLIEHCTIDMVISAGVRIASPSSKDTVIRNSTISNSKIRAVYNAGTNTLVDRVRIVGTGLAGGITNGAISQYPSSGSCEVANTVMLDCRNKYGIQAVQTVRNTIIQQDEVSGYTAIQNADLIENCRVNRIIAIKNDCTIDGLVLYTRTELGTNAINLSDRTNCTVTNCKITLPSRYAICEIRATDYNVITNNIAVGGSGFQIIGANTVASGNSKITESTAEQFRYRVVDGQATIAAWLDTDTVQAVIPSAVEGYPVTAIDPWAFALNENLISVLIPDSVTVIGANAFFGCDGLTEVHYPGTVAQWDAIDIGVNNDILTDGEWHCPSNRYDEAVDHSVMDTVGGNGLAFRFTLYASGVAVDENKRVDLTGATVNYLGVDCKLVGFGAVVTNNAAVGKGDFALTAVNGTDVRNVPAVYLQKIAADSCAFAARVIDIPDDMKRIAVYARPYYVIEVGGEQMTIYGNTDVSSCNDAWLQFADLDTWYVSNITDAVKGYKSKIGSNALTFSMMSDMHLRQNAPYIVDNIEASSVWADLVDNDFIMMSGDFIIGDLSKEDSLRLIDTAMATAASHVSVPVYAVKGNHDTNEDYQIGTDPTTGKAVYSTADRITDEEFYDHAIAQSASTIVTDPANPYGGYYYVNFPEQKIRMICLNTTEIRNGADILTADKADFRWSGVKSVEQLTWLADTALQVPEGWAVMMVSHIPPITGAEAGIENETSADAPFHTRGIRAAALTDLCEAFVAGSQGTVAAKIYVDGAVKDVTVSYDFSAQGAGEFIGHFCGHVHEDSLSEYNGINYVVVNCTTPQKRWDTSLDREAGTETALSLNSFIINRETRTVECIKVGTGESYSFTW